MQKFRSNELYWSPFFTGYIFSYSCFLSYGLTISLIITGVAWFILIAEEGEWQQKFPG